MSHISRIKTQLMEKAYLLEAIEDLGYTYEVGNLKLSGMTESVAVDVKVHLRMSFDIGLHRTDRRFPRKGTCLAIYSRCVNAQEPVEQALKVHFPWCNQYPDQLKQLFKSYTAHKHEQNILDYDDLLLYWAQMAAEPALASEIGAFFGRLIVPVDYAPGAERRLVEVEPEVIYAAFLAWADARLDRIAATTGRRSDVESWIDREQARLRTARAATLAAGGALLDSLGLRTAG